LWNQAKLGHKPRYTWNEAVVRFIEEKSGVSSIETIKIHLRWLHPHLNGMALADIDRKKIDEISCAKQSEYVVVKAKGGTHTKKQKIQPATVNKVLGVISSVMNAAIRWEWIDKAPVISKLRVPTKRVSWLTREQAKRLIDALPRHLADMAIFSLETGLRSSNVTNLKWSQVDMDRKMAWIHPDEAKSRRAIPVPLSDTAGTLLHRQKQITRLPKYSDFVFVFRGKPVQKTSTPAWYRTLSKLGMENFRWHDLRHTWASWHIQKGTPLHVLQALGGWETTEMVQRYAHLSADHLAQWVQSLTFSASNIVTNDCNLTAMQF
jgi:integrase